jgi:hypothetical protein
MIQITLISKVHRCFLIFHFEIMDIKSYHENNYEDVPCAN